MTIRNNGKVVGVLSLVGGAVLGAGVALLIAPRSGRGTRREIALHARRAGRRVKRAAREFSDGVSGTADSMESAAAGILEKGKETALGMERELREAFEAGRDMLGRRRLTHRQDPAR